MATTMYLDTTLTDMAGKSAPVEVEAGTLTFEQGVKQIYLTLNGETLILDEASGRQLCEAFAAISVYLGYDG